MATLLSKAAPSTTLYSILQDHQFESGAGDHSAAVLESLVRFKSSVEIYLEVSLYMNIVSLRSPMTPYSRLKKCDVEVCPKPTVLRST